MDMQKGFEIIAGELKAVEYYLGHKENLFSSFYPEIFGDMRASHPVDLQDPVFLRLLIIHSLEGADMENGSKAVENFASAASHRLLETDVLLNAGFRV